MPAAACETNLAMRHCKAVLIVLSTDESGSSDDEGPPGFHLVTEYGVKEVLTTHNPDKGAGTWEKEGTEVKKEPALQPVAVPSSVSGLPVLADSAPLPTGPRQWMQPHWQLNPSDRGCRPCSDAQV